MVYPTCPKCGNAYNTLYVEDTEIGGYKLKAVCCHQCGPVYLFNDLTDIKEKLEDIDSRVGDIESNLQ